jgi:uncharacterized protein YaiI (UPF0178 family)
MKIFRLDGGLIHQGPAIYTHFMQPSIFSSLFHQGEYFNDEEVRDMLAREAFEDKKRREEEMAKEEKEEEEAKKEEGKKKTRGIIIAS